jgi:hypothetical protein
LVAGVDVPIPTSPLFCILISSVRVPHATFPDVIVAVLSLEKIIGFPLFVARTLVNPLFLTNPKLRSFPDTIALLSAGVSIVPLTVRLSPGELVPIPTFPAMIVPFVGAVIVGYPTENHHPETLSRDAGTFVPIPRFPLVRSLIFSTLLVRNARPKLSRVPMKFDAGSVPAFPAIAHGIAAAPVGVCQLARPVASDMRIFPAHGTHPVIFT